MSSTWIIHSNVQNSSIYINSTDQTISRISSTSTILSLLNENSANIDDTLSSKIIKYILIILVSSLTLTTVMGNLLVILAFICDRRLRTYSNYFILNLSIADLLIGLIW